MVLTNQSKRKMDIETYHFNFNVSFLVVAPFGTVFTSKLSINDLDGQGLLRLYPFSLFDF